jgi:hypothetical protein
MYQPDQDSVQTALGEILGIEKDRLQTEADRRRQEDEEERRRCEAEARARLAEEERRNAEEDRRRQEEERRREQEEAERVHRHQLDELRVRQETEARARLAEEELRLLHERELTRIEAARRRVPAWVWAAIGALVAAGVVAAVVPYLEYREASDALAASQATLAREKTSWNEQLKARTAELRGAERERDAAVAQARDAQRTIDELRRLVDGLRVAAERIPGLEARIADLEHKLATAAASGRPGPNGHGPRPPVTRPPSGSTTTQCVNQGTPLEECFTCPRDSRCR